MPQQTFEQWLASPLGSDVWDRIQRNRHHAMVDLSAAYFDTIEDVHQKALIWIWQQWQEDPEFSEIDKLTTSPSHKAAFITKRAVSRARCMYAKRRREGRENLTDLEYDDGDFFSKPYIPLKYVLRDAGAIRPTDLRDHDRCVVNTDLRNDVTAAIERTMQRLRAYQAARIPKRPDGSYNRNFTGPDRLEHIARSIIEAFSYHYVDRYSQLGNMRAFLEDRGIGKNVLHKWKDMIFIILREELAAYAPQETPPLQAAAADEIQ